jgi:hypothetical protein
VTSFTTVHANSRDDELPILAPAHFAEYVRSKGRGSIVIRSSDGRPLNTEELLKDLQIDWQKWAGDVRTGQWTERLKNVEFPMDAYHVPSNQGPLSVSAMQFKLFAAFRSGATGTFKSVRYGELKSALVVYAESSADLNGMEWKVTAFRRRGQSIGQMRTSFFNPKREEEWTVGLTRVD